MENIKEFSDFLNEQDKDLNTTTDDGELFNTVDVKNAIRFAIEKFSNYHEAMSKQEADKVFNEWQEKGEFYEKH